MLEEQDEDALCEDTGRDSLLSTFDVKTAKDDYVAGELGPWNRPYCVINSDTTSVNTCHQNYLN